MISILIPSLNEGKVLPRLLKSIRRQNYPNEVILADANSVDKTVEIAKKFNVKVVKGGIPSVGRNSAAKNAKGDIFLFLDADTKLVRGFLKKNIEEFNEKNLDVAICLQKFFKKSASYRFAAAYHNMSFNLLENIYPVGTGYCIFVRKNYWKKVKGFNEKVNVLEDVDFVQRCIKAGANYGIIKSKPIVVDSRRYEKEGFANLTKYYAKLLIDQIKNGPAKIGKWKYDFGEWYKE